MFYGTNGQLEYDVVVAPGADPGAFALRASGARPELDDNGELLLADAVGTLRLHRPIAYQRDGDKRTPVDSSFAIAANGDVRFRLGAYDPTRTLVIDPVVSYATYLGGNGFEQGTAIAVDGAGNAYVAGYTLSTDFPTVSPYDRSLGKSADVDVFVAKLNPTGTALVWSTYIGGAGSVDRAVGIAVDANGSAYLTGSTTSNNFPVSATAWQKPLPGGGAFVTKLSSAGNALAYSTYVGGVTSNAIAVDREGNAYIAGSATPLFAATASALQTRPGNTQATGFVLKLNGTGSAPLYATFLGGSGTDEATSIAVDATGAAFVGGWTASTDFPTVSPIQREPRGQKDAFVTKLDPTGSRLVYATRLGGNLDDAINAIAIDDVGAAYVAGETYSADFPVKAAFQPVKAGARLINSSTGSAFVAKLSASGSALAYSSFLGGEVCRTPWSNVAPGSYVLTARATDNRGATTTSAPVPIVVTSNAAPSITLRPLGNEQYFAPATLVLSADAADSDGTIDRVEFRVDGALVGVAAANPYSYVWNGVGTGSYSITATAIDDQGAATTTTMNVNVGGALAVAMSPGLDGTTVRDNNVLVRGIVSAPLNSAMTINGVVAHIDDFGQFQANDIPLDPGANAVTAVVTTQDGQATSHTILVNSTGRGAFVTHAAPTEGLNSLAVRFTVENPDDLSFSRITFDLDNDGATNVTATPAQFVDGKLTVSATYPIGTWIAVITAYDDRDEVIYSARKAIVVLSPAALRAKLKSVYDGMLGRLRVGNVAGALTALTGTARDRYGPVLSQLEATLPSVVDDIGELREINFGIELAELSVVRTTPTGSEQFMLYMLRSEDGIWRFDGM